MVLKKISVISIIIIIISIRLCVCLEALADSRVLHQAKLSPQPRLHQAREPAAGEREPTLR